MTPGKNYRFRAQTGAGTLLFIAVLLPLLFFLLTVTVEMNSFLAQRQLALTDLDQLTRRLLREDLSSQEVTRSLEARLKSRSAFVRLTRVSSLRGSAQAVLDADLIYTTTFPGIFTGAVNIGLSGIPFSISSKVGRVPYDVMIVTDRSIQSGEDPCASGHLLHLNSFARALFLSVGVNGASSIIPAVLDPVSNNVVRLDRPSEPSANMLCSGAVGFTPTDDAFTAIRGVTQFPIDKHVFANSLHENLFQDRTKKVSRKQLLLILTRGFDDRWSALKEITPMLQATAAATGIVLSINRVIVGSNVNCSTEWENVSTADITSRCTALGDGSQLSGEFLTALLGDTSEAVLER